MNEVIWRGTLDGRYRCEVERIGKYDGNLTITDTESNKVLHSETVSLMYGAEFGPDHDDVTAWQDICESVVDEEAK